MGQFGVELFVLMLNKLTVTNLAVVEKAEIVFDQGLNVITGETGAGKSVMMSALELVLGGRAEGSQVRDGANEAEIEAIFGDKIIRRTVTREGRSRAWIDDESVTIAELKEFGRGLVDIHGPRANQRLLEEDFQRETLDAFGGVSLIAYAKAYGAYKQLKAELAALGEPLSEDELDFLRFQVNELEEARIGEDDETLEERHAAAAHAEEILTSANEITEGLGGDRGVENMLGSLLPKFAAASRHFPAANEWASEAEEIMVRLQALSRTIAKAVSNLDSSADELEALDRRVTLINKLKRKYRQPSVNGLVELLNEKRAKLDGAENREAKTAQLVEAIASAEKEVISAGEALGLRRTKAGERLAKAITAELRGLGFLQAKFSVRLERVEAGPTGIDRVVYMFEPNPGESARPLSAIASSGEIARVMLAAKVVLAGAAKAEDSVGTMVFDEIDANIGGEVGKAVGEKLREVAKGRQVLAITHLPQSAVFGERHLVVSKSVSGGRTRTQVSEVSGEARVKEIARMLGGEKLTSVVRKHAEELLELSR